MKSKVSEGGYLERLQAAAAAGLLEIVDGLVEVSWYGSSQLWL